MPSGTPWGGPSPVAPAPPVAPEGGAPSGGGHALGRLALRHLSVLGSAVGEVGDGDPSVLQALLLVIGQAPEHASRPATGAAGRLIGRGVGARVGSATSGHEYDPGQQGDDRQAHESGSTCASVHRHWFLLGCLHPDAPVEGAPDGAPPPDGRSPPEGIPPANDGIAVWTPLWVAVTSVALTVPALFFFPVTVTVSPG